MVLLKKDIEDASTASKTRPLDLLTCHIVTMRVLMIIDGVDNDDRGDDVDDEDSAGLTVHQVVQIVE